MFKNDQFSRLNNLKVNEMRKAGKFAFIPLSVPRVIKYKDNMNKDSPLKTLRLEEL